MNGKTLIVAASLVIGGCASVPDPVPVSRFAVQNDKGHVVGYREVPANPGAATAVPHIAYFTPILGKSGSVIGYEEAAGDGAFIRDLRGRMIGRRFSDQRGRMTNPTSKGYTVIVRSHPLNQIQEGEQVSSLGKAVAIATGE